MPTTTVTISGNVADLVGDTFTGRTIRVLVESSEPLSEGTVAGGVRLNPYYPATIDANGDLSVEVPVTSGGSPLYQLRFEGQSGAEVRRETLGWFDMTVDDTLEGIRDRTFVPAVVTPTLVADVTSAAADVLAFGDTQDAMVANFAANPTSDVNKTILPVFNVRRYGALGDGTADDTTEIQAAINAAAVAGGTVFFPPGTYKITAPLTVTGNHVHLFGRGATINGATVAASTTLSDKFGIDATGTLGTPVALTADLAKDGTTVTVGSTTGFAAGDLVRITSNQDYTDGTGANYGNRGALHRVKAITSGTQLTLTEPSFFAYAAASSATIAKVVPLRGLVVDGLKVVMGGTGDSHCGIQVSYADEPTVRNVEVDGCEDTGIEFRTVWGGLVDRCKVSNATSGSLGTTGYGVSILEASRGARVTASSFDNCRHGVTGGGTIVSILVRVVGNRATNMLDAAFDAHEECWWWDFDSNTVVGGASSGILIRGQACTVRRNVIRNTGSIGVHVKSFDINTTPLAGAQVTDNDIENTGGASIQWEGTTDCRIAGGRIAGNRLVRGKFANIYVYLSDDLTIENNECDGTWGSTGSDGNNIRLVGSSTSSRCQRVVVRGCTFRNAEQRWVKADYTNGLTIDSSYVVHSPNNTFLANTIDVRVADLTGPLAPAASATVSTDAAFSLTPMVSAETVVHTGTLTTNRTITLSTVNAYTGARHRVVRTGGGAFTLSVGGLKALSTNQWADVMFDGTTWVLVGYGTL